MIEITARLVRDKSAVFLAGEVVECFVTFKNVDENNFSVSEEPTPSTSSAADCEGATSLDGSTGVENLAWATVSIQGFCWTSSKKGNEIPIGSGTALAPSGIGTEILATPPKFMFCDLVLKPNETKTYLFKEEIPKMGPPTYRGTFVKYFYKLTVATQRVGSKVQMLQVPIRVLPINFTTEEELESICNETEDSVSPLNPFLIKKKTEYLELMLDYLQNVTSQRSPTYYQITNKHGKVGRFCIFKPRYKLGEDIVCTLDFSAQTIKCVQYSVTLQCEEIVPPLQDSSEGSSVSSPTSEETLKSGTVSPSLSALNLQPTKTKITEHSKYHEVTIGLELTYISLPVPLNVTPSFKTDEVEVRWRLHFQFVTSTNKGFDYDCEPGQTWNAPKQIEIETMIWNLPITLMSANPIQIPQQSETQTLIIE